MTYGHLMKNRFLKFFLGILLVIIIFELMLIERSSNKDGFVNYFATFDKIDGVNVGADVTLSGIKVGEVSKIILDNNYPNLQLTVDKKLKISSDSSVSIQTDGLFGSKFLVIEIGGMESYMKDGDAFSFADDSMLIQDLLKNIISIGEKNKL